MRTTRRRPRSGQALRRQQVAWPGNAMNVQYRVAVTKKEELVEGPDGADVVITVPLADAQDDEFDATVAYMRGRLKSTGSTGALFDVLKSGAAGAAIRRLASQP